MQASLARQCLENEWAEMRAASNLRLGFTRALEVEPGGPITSRDWNLFAAAVNERILSGLGDAWWRISQYLLGLFRSMVTPADALHWHAEGEFFETWQAMLPNVATWPEGNVADSGLPEPEGPNVANPMMAWVYGNAGASLLNEARRLSAVPSALNVTSAEEKFMQGVLARGLRDPLTGYEIAPARQCALEFARLAYRKDGVFAQTYGGFLPGPERSSTDCEDPCQGDARPPCDTAWRTNLISYWTCTKTTSVPGGMLSDIPSVTNKPTAPGCADTDYYTLTTETIGAADYYRIWFNGTCGICNDYIDPTDPLAVKFFCRDGGYPGSCGGSDSCGSAAYCRHINVWFQLPLGWWIIFNDGAQMFLPRANWLEGPYEVVNGLAHDYGDQIRRAVNGFNREFRGSDAQRAEPSYNLDHAFDIQEYGTTQNYLAPNRAIQSGDTLTAAYPIWRLGPGTYFAGQALTRDGGGSSPYTWADGHVATHALVILHPSSSSNSVSLRIVSDTSSWSATANKDGVIIKLPDARLQGVTVELTADVTIAAGEELIVQATELQACKTEWHDLYVVLRKGGAKLIGQGGAGTSIDCDGVGTWEDDSDQIFAQYRAAGAIINPGNVAGIDDPFAVNENAVYDAARRMYQSVRILNRFAFRDYSLENGDSVLWFTPNPRTSEYQMTFPWETGEPQINLFDGMRIERVPPTGGKSSRWALGMWLKPWSSGGSSDLEAEKYGDQIPDINRCYVDDKVSAADSDFNGHTNRNAALSHNLYGQAPTGWNYARTFAGQYVNHALVPGATTDTERQFFAKSCRLYEPPVEIRCIEIDTSTGETLIKVTLMGRLRNTAGEPGGAPTVSIGRSGWGVGNHGTAFAMTSPNGWDYDAIKAEPFACDERNLRLYLFERWQGTHDPTSFGIGDGALSNNGEPRWGDATRNAAIMPHFCFVKLLPQMRVDLNDDQDESDSLFTHDEPLHAEWVLRCMVEGAVAHEGQLSCADPLTSRTYDMVWRDLCQRLFGMPSVGTFAMHATNRTGGSLSTSDIRADGPEGFGPLPNTYASAELFNRLVRIVNAMTRYRVMLPWGASYAQATGTATKSLAPDGYCDGGVPVNCTAAAGRSVTRDIGPTANKGDYGVELDLGIGVAVFGITTCGGSGVGGFTCSASPPTNYDLITSRTTTHLTFDVLDQHVFLNAVPESWRGLITETAPHKGAYFQDLTIKEQWEIPLAGGVEECDPVHKFSTCLFDQVTTTTTDCVFLRSVDQELDCGAYAPPGWKYWLWWPSAPQQGCTGGSTLTRQLSLMADSPLVIEVPVVDRREEDVVPATENAALPP
jgi:hypothetical protein